MIIYKKGNIFNEKCEAIVNPVNCVGIMGAGLAKQFKNKFPTNFEAYKKACQNKKVTAGKMFVTKVDKTIIVNFPTKRHWRDNSNIEDIKEGLHNLLEVIKKLDIKSIAIPPIGCGLGGLDWNKVKIEIENTLSKLPNTKIIILEPQQ